MANEIKTEGTNRTGIALHPVTAPQMREGAREGEPSTPGDVSYLATLRGTYLEERLPVGTMPPPASVGGAVKAGVKALAGKHPNALLDKLGERLAFERTGARLYEAALTAVSAIGESSGGPTVEDLRDIRDAEVRHAHIVEQAIRELGGDPTTLTPSADMGAVASQGLVQVITDPRASRSQRLCALLVAELTDHDGWELLVELARAADHDEIARRFEGCLREEATHLARVRGWLRGHALATLQNGRSGVET